MVHIVETWILRRKCQRQNALLSCYWLDSSMWLSQRALWIQESGFVYRGFQYNIFANSSELSKPICLKSGKYSHVYDSSVFFFGMTRVRWTVQFGNKERGQLLQFLCNGAIAWSLESVLFSINLCYVLECFRWKFGPSSFNAWWLQTVCIVWDLPFTGQ